MICCGNPSLETNNDWISLYADHTSPLNGWMIFHFCLQISESETNCRLVGPGPKYSIDSRDYFYYILCGSRVTSLSTSQKIQTSNPNSLEFSVKDNDSMLCLGWFVCFCIGTFTLCWYQVPGRWLPTLRVHLYVVQSIFLNYMEFSVNYCWQ